MAQVSEKQALQKVSEQLTALLERATDLADTARVLSDEAANGVDLLVGHGPYRIPILWRGSSALPSIASAIKTLTANSHYHHDHEVIPLLAVPFMTAAGAEHCEQSGVSWLDLSGNAHITAPGIYIHIEGKPNQFAQRGRPSNLFAPKASRVARHLLRFSTETFLQTHIADATNLSDGYVSKVISRLEEVGLIYRDEEDRVGVRTPDLLLDSWAEKYRFSKHHIQRFTVAARTGQEVLERVSHGLMERGIANATTGLSGAWLFDHFASFRTATFYLRNPLSEADLDALRLHPTEQGANLWLVLPNDDGVFHGVMKTDGFHHVHPVQIYLDLLHHPERSAEAAEHLRKNHLRWDEQ